MTLEMREVREAVWKAYSAAAERPGDKHAFPVGRRFAESVGYPPGLLDALPPAAVDAFAGVSNVAVFAEIPPGATVLDLGCGAGLDALVAARRVGRLGRIIGIDFGAAMLERARCAAAEAGADNVEFIQAAAERLPLPGGLIDVALVNGIFNLNPARAAILGELGRVVRRGGSVFAAELILAEPLPEDVRTNQTNWFA